MNWFCRVLAILKEVTMSWRHGYLRIRALCLSFRTAQQSVVE